MSELNAGSILLDDTVRLAHAPDGTPIYAYGTVQAYFPSLSVEREFYHALQGARLSNAAFDIHDEASLIALNQSSDLRKVLHEVLIHPDNISIAREMCWTLQSPSGSELYLIDPDGNGHLHQLIHALKPDLPMQMRRVFVGQETSSHSNPLCRAWALPSVKMLHLFEAPVNSMTGPSRSGNVIVVHVPAGGGNASRAEDPFQIFKQSTLQLADNSGSGDRNRTINYVLLNLASFFNHAWELTQVGGLTLTGARVEPLEYGGNPGRTRVIFEFSNANGAIQSWFYIVDAAGAFPYVVTDWQAYINTR